jgi:hypothetical protein
MKKLVYCFRMYMFIYYSMLASCLHERKGGLNVAEENKTLSSGVCS